MIPGGHSVVAGLTGCLGLMWVVIIYCFRRVFGFVARAVGGWVGGLRCLVTAVVMLRWVSFCSGFVD